MESLDYRYYRIHVNKHTRGVRAPTARCGSSSRTAIRACRTGSRPSGTPRARCASAGCAPTRIPSRARASCPLASLRSRKALMTTKSHARHVHALLPPAPSRRDPRLQPRSSRAGAPLSRAEAPRGGTRATGLDDFGDPSFREPLERLRRLDRARGEAPSARPLRSCADASSRMLANRLRLEACYRDASGDRVARASRSRS